MARAKRTIKGFAKTGSISRKAARSAVKEVSGRRSATTGKYHNSKAEGQTG